MIKAAIYQASRPKGVIVKMITQPQLTGTTYEPNEGNYLKLLSMTAMTCLMTLLSSFLSLLRVVFPSVPPSFGACKDRHMILCKVHAVGVNPVDAKRLYGDKVPPMFHPFIAWMLENRVCGIDFSGTVVGIPDAYKGNGSQVLKVGDDVFGEMPPFVGSLAEYVLVPSDMIALKPKNMTFATAAALPLVGLTALQAIEGAEESVRTNRYLLAHSRNGSSSSSSQKKKKEEVNREGGGGEGEGGEKMNVLVLGASGGTGHVALQVAKARGHRVTAVCGSRNREWVDSLGSDCTICYDSGEDLLQRLHEQADLFGLYHIVFDSVSSDDPRDAASGYEQRLRMTRGGEGGGRVGVLDQQAGMYLMLGGHVSDWIKAHLLRFLGLNLFGRHRLLFWVRFPVCFEYLSQLRSYCEKRQLSTTLAGTYPFTTEGVQQAFEDIMSRRTTGKLVVEVSDAAMSTSAPDTVTLCH